MIKKEIIMSIRPEHLVNVLNGNKTLELRKTVPKEFKGWVSLYCTINGDNLVYNGKSYQLEKGERLGYDLNGKVIARFWFDKYEKVECRTVPYLKNGTKYDDYIENGVYEVENTKIDNYGVVFERDDELIETMFNNNDFKKMCLTPQELHDYIGLGNNGYAWHIKQLEIFDAPLDLSDFTIRKKDDFSTRNYYTFSEVALEKAPQSYQFVWR